MADMGSFSGNPITEWLTEPGADRQMKVQKEFFYIDPKGRKWVAPAGSIVNGASIPAALWSMVGSPYTGEYRRASIVHDVACDDAAVSRKEADEMFYHACLAGGCTLFEARVLYAGVRIGAAFPDVRFWTEAVAARPLAVRGRFQPTLTQESVQNTYREIAADIESRPETMTFEQLEGIVDHHLAAEVAQ
ncbi:DUF1353 domain-containing protein [Spirosoma sp. RP8]|uniref:DUF1353 domain-containing protein n=1 Tax=Spirosoma liriopis TaxID=2937440 RepID=A0ABT0HSW4_9BACT|nr:DUF1353 domain-containing protein [Spirosoma liriopis]MCK8495272.1 DUF1353 domain-containing protein [Spirosoma liriopis]